VDELTAQEQAVNDPELRGLRAQVFEKAGVIGALVDETAGLTSEAAAIEIKMQAFGEQKLDLSTRLQELNSNAAEILTLKTQVDEAQMQHRARMTLSGWRPVLKAGGGQAGGANEARYEFGNARMFELHTFCDDGGNFVTTPTIELKGTFNTDATLVSLLRTARPHIDQLLQACQHRDQIVVLTAGLDQTLRRMESLHKEVARINTEYTVLHDSTADGKAAIKFVVGGHFTQVVLRVELSAQYPFAHLPASVKVNSLDASMDTARLQQEIVGRVVPLTTGYGRLTSILHCIRGLI
jgi:hypothetical protein